MARFWRKRWWWTGLAGAVGVAGVFFAGVTIIPMLAQKRQLQAIREAGFPSTPEELNAWYEAVPEEENAALLVGEAIDLYVDHKMMRRLRRNEKGLDPAELEQAKKEYLEANRATIEKLHEAAERPRSRYATDLSMGPEMEIEHLIEIWNYLDELLRLEAIDQAERGNGAEATRALVSGFRLVNTLQREPTLIAQAVRIGATREILNGFGEVLSKVQLEKQELERLMAVLEETEKERAGALMRGYAGDRVLGMMQFETVYEELQSELQKAPWKERIDLIRIRLNKPKDLNTFLKLMEENLNVLTNEFPEILEISRAVDRRYDEHLREYLTEGLPGTLTLRASTAIAHNVRAEGSLRAKLRCARVAVAIEMDRIEHGGSLPDSLEALTPDYLEEVPFNPLDGKRLVYEKTGDGYRIVAPIPAEVWDEHEKPREVVEIVVEWER